MKKFANSYPDKAMVQQLVAQIFANVTQTTTTPNETKQTMTVSKRATTIRSGTSWVEALVGFLQLLVALATPFFRPRRRRWGATDKEIEASQEGLARFTQAFRAQYYQLAKRVLQEQTQVIPCQAGWASGHIAPNGDVWTCCIRAEPAGNLRETGYDLRPIWFERAGRLGRLRQSIAGKECACPMANASYANMLLHAPTVARVSKKVL